MVKTELMRRIFKTTIPSELQVMYLLAQGLDILINDVDRRMANQCRQAGLDVRHGFVGDDKSNLAQFSKSIKHAKYWFERMEPLVNQYTFGEGGVAGYDSFRADAKRDCPHDSHVLQPLKRRCGGNSCGCGVERGGWNV